MAREVALGLTQPLAADPLLLAAAVVLDLALGDPRYPAHPIRLMGWTLMRVEGGLRRVGAGGYAGGIALFAILSVLSVGVTSALVLAAQARAPLLATALHLFFLYSLLALGDLLRHGRVVESALRRGDLSAAHAAVAQLVGRDTDDMDAGACRRAVIESVSENLTDGFVSPIFWYALFGLPALVLFKVVSTLDSMVGYKTERYLRFGWCGARLDDVMNWIPARLTWLLLVASAVLVSGCSPLGALRVGWRQHAVLPSPNSGWSEAATAGAIRRRLIGPIRLGGRLVTDTWLGDPAMPPAENAADYRHAASLMIAAGLLSASVAVVVLIYLR